MGKAKIGREKLRAAMVAELERLMVPASAEENVLNDEIRALTFYSLTTHCLDSSTATLNHQADKEGPRFLLSEYRPCA